MEAEDYQFEQKDKSKIVGKKMIKGALMPSGTHLNWKDKIDSMMK